MATSETAVFHRSLSSRPPTVVSASGSYLTLQNGRKILDSCGGAAVSIIGHGNVEVIKAMFEQSTMVSYVHNGYYTTESAEQLARCLVERHPSSPNFDPGFVKAYLVSSGSEANDAALKCAKQYWFEKGQRRTVYVTRRQSYHGATIGAMSISDMPARKVPYDGITMPNVVFVGAADAFHHQGVDETETSFVTRLLHEIEETFERIGPENIISFSGETVSGAALGSMSAPRGYWPGVRDLCDKHGILLILDEVMTAIGRTGTYFAFEQEGIKPDIVTIGKGLGGGYAPISAMLVNNNVIQAIQEGSSKFNHGHTFQAHAMCCAAALRVQTIVIKEQLVNRAADMGVKLEKLLHEAFDGAKHVADIRGRGLLQAVEFMLDPQTKIPFAKHTEFGAKVQRAAFRLGVALYPGAGTIDGVVGDHVLIAPAYNVSEEELECTVKELRKGYDQVVQVLFRAKI